LSHVVAYTDIAYPEECIRDGSLAAALDELGMELVADKKTYNWFGSWVEDYHKEDAAYKQGIDPSTYGRCEHVIRAKGAPADAYEIGLVKNPNGAGFVPVLDFYGQGNQLRRLVGDKGQHLGTAYNKAAIRMQAKQRGYVLTEETLPSGKIKLTATRYGGI
jgi:hypothetical protein